METLERSQAPGLNLLSKQAEEFNFYQAIRMLEGLADAQETSHQIKYEAINGQAFTPNFLAGVETQDEQSKVSVNGFTLAGQQGPLPDIFAEMLQREKSAGNKGPEAFLNLFNHRLLKLLYDIKKQLDPMLFNSTAGNSQLFNMLSAATGHTTTNLFERLPLNAEQLMSFASLLIANRQNYSAFKHIVETLFDCSIDIEPCQGAWRSLPTKFRATLGDRKATLGSGIGLGKKYWDNQAAIGVLMTINSVEQCRRLMPKGKDHDMLIAILSFLTDGKYQINVQLQLDWKKIPKAELIPNSNMHLGQSSWLKREKEDGKPLNLPKFTVYPNLKTKFWSSAA